MNQPVTERRSKDRLDGIRNISGNTTQSLAPDSSALEKKSSASRSRPGSNPRAIAMSQPHALCARALGGVPAYRDKYGDLIQEAIDLQSLELDDVSFVTAEEDPSIPPQRRDGASARFPHMHPRLRSGAGAYSRAGALRLVERAQLNPRYTFEAFVIGNGNQFARAAALAVAERPSRPTIRSSSTAEWHGKTH